MTVSDEAVEAAVDALVMTRMGDYNIEMPEFRKAAREVLEAAAPFIAAQAWDEGWNAFARYDSDQRQSYPDNPYRSGT